MVCPKSNRTGGAILFAKIILLACLDVLNLQLMAQCTQFGRAMCFPTAHPARELPQRQLQGMQGLAVAQSSAAKALTTSRKEYMKRSLSTALFLRTWVARTGSVMITACSHASSRHRRT